VSDPDQAADLAALADLLAWRAAAAGRCYKVRADEGGTGVTLWHRGGVNTQHADGPTVREAVRGALAAWGGGSDRML
jgi:hypothetical protein